MLGFYVTKFLSDGRAKEDEKGLRRTKRDERGLKWTKEDEGGQKGCAMEAADFTSRRPGKPRSSRSVAGWHPPSSPR